MPKTASQRTKSVCIYTTRCMPTIIRDRLRAEAAIRHVTMEDVLNLALEEGLGRLERASARTPVMKARGK